VATKRKFLIRTFGCQMNEHDSQRIASELTGDGMTRTEDLEEADVVVFNTCCIRQNADDKLYGHLGQLKALKQRHPGLQIAVGGCLAQKDRELLLERAPHVDVVFGTHNVGRVAQLLKLSLDSGTPLIEVPDAPSLDEGTDFPSALAVRHEHPYAAWLTIQVGCDNSCAYCVVPQVRGPEVSRPFGELIEELETLAALGTVEVILLGQNVNSYGRDLTNRGRHITRPGTDLAWLAGEAWVKEGACKSRPVFADLLRVVGQVPGINRVRFTSPHPKDLRPETIVAMAETPAVCEQLHLPLQSGSDRILSAMHRGYSAERYLDLVSQARAAVSDLAVTTDIIVGFPGETEEDFERTLEVASQAAYDSAYTFIYSPRPGTLAAQMQELFVPAGEVADRFDRLKVVIERSALEHNAARVGRVEEVIVEGPSKKDPDTLTGRTRQGKIVHFRAADPGLTPPGSTGSPVGPKLTPGTFAGVRIERAAPHYMAGTLVSCGQGHVASPLGRIRVVAS
jgi:tRNA-2-methylthio-N6-dimethylallyladenosine synthase